MILCVLNVILHPCNCIGVGVVDGLLYAVGGHDGPLVRKSVEVLNPELNMWTQVADMHYCRRNAGKCYYNCNTCNIVLFERI